MPDSLLEGTSMFPSTSSAQMLPRMSRPLPGSARSSSSAVSATRSPSVPRLPTLLTPSSRRQRAPAAASVFSVFPSAWVAAEPTPRRSRRTVPLGTRPAGPSRSSRTLTTTVPQSSASSARSSPCCKGVNGVFFSVGTSKYCCNA